ncbi:hypothetical protein C8R44DRAFT_873721 [Mycena epipterygia]|nr:hypothetical protein C8R44DRAFT_873721 [Mycena epipterygia]
MEGPLETQSSMSPILMYRNDSEESTESAFDSVLNTPADEHPSPFDSLRAKMSRPPQILEGLENHLDDYEGDDLAPKRPLRVSLSRQFSKALQQANQSASDNIRARSNSVERVYHELTLPDSSGLMSFASPDMQSEPEQTQTPEPPTESYRVYHEDMTPPSEELMTFPSPEMPSEPQRPQTPERPISDIYNTSSPQSITRTTPRARPPLRRDVFSPARIPVPVGEPAPTEIAISPLAHSTLRHRKGMYLLLNDSITGEPTSETHAVDLYALDQVDLNDASKDDVVLASDTLAESDLDSDSDDSDSDLAVPKLSPLFPLQVILFPVYCILVGAAILLCPTRLHAIAFPASAASMSLPHRVLAGCLPITAPPSPSRAFAHWATVARMHVVLFLATLAGTTYLSPQLGALLAGACAVGVVRAWGDFAVDDSAYYGLHTAGAELGGEVRQMLYQVLFAPDCGFGDGYTLTNVEGQYFLVPAAREAETRAEILAAGGLDEEDEEDEDELDE